MTTPMVHFIAVWLHILAAALWIGGMLFLALVLVPVVRSTAIRALGPELMRLTGRRFRTVGWVALLLLIATGIVNLDRKGIDWVRFTGTELWSTTWGRVLAIKLALVLVVLALSVTHDFFVGPRASEALRRNPSGPEALRLRRAASWMGRLNLLLALAIVALAVMLVRGVPVV